MTFDVTISFVSNLDYSNTNKNSIIEALPPKNKVNQESLNDMNKLGSHTFTFPKQETAANFANKLFVGHSEILNIQTNFKLG